MQYEEYVDSYENTGGAQEQSWNSTHNQNPNRPLSAQRPSDISRTKGSSNLHTNLDEVNEIDEETHENDANEFDNDDEIIYEDEDEEDERNVEEEEEDEENK